MTEEVTTRVEAFYLNEDEENQPAKIKAADGNYYSTFQPEDDLPGEFADTDVSGAEVRIEYEEVQKSGNTYRNISGDGVELVDTAAEPEDGDHEAPSSDGYVSGADRQTSIEAQSLLNAARETELTLSARSDDYEFTKEGVQRRAEEYADILRELKEEISSGGGS